MRLKPENMFYAIDYGTSNSLIATALPDSVTPPLPLFKGGKDATILRSLIYTPSKGQWEFGDQAIQSYTEQLGEGRFFRSVKKYLPEIGFKGTAVHGQFQSLHDLIAMFLKEMRHKANQHWNCDVTNVLLGRPAAFSLDEEADKLAEERLRAAAKQAGFKEIHFCPEPVAAAQSFRRGLAKEQVVLIADFGGGTSDYTILKMSREAFKKEDVLAIKGIPIAGDRFDGSIMKHMICPHFGTKVKYRLPMGNVDLSLPIHIINKMCSPADISLLGRKDIAKLLQDAHRWSLSDEDARAMDQLFLLVEEHLGYKLFAEIERCKIAMSSAEQAQFEFLYPGIKIHEELSTKDFEEVTAEHVEKICGKLDETIAEAGIKASDIDIVCCTGGTAQLPALNSELAKRFGADKLNQFEHFHSVVGGLAHQAREEWLAA